MLPYLIVTALIFLVMAIGFYIDSFSQNIEPPQQMFYAAAAVACGVLTIWSVILIAKHIFS